MIAAVKVVYEHGVLKPKEPLELEEHAEVEVLILARPKVGDDDPTGWKTARELIGCITEPLIANNVSEDPDQYIYRK